MKKTFALLFIVLLTFLLLPYSGCEKASSDPIRYEITATYDPESRTVQGSMDFSYTNPTEVDLAALKFNLYANAYRENADFSPVSPSYVASAYYRGKSYGQEKIESVTGNVADWKIGGKDENILIVNLSEPLFPEESVSLSVTFSTTLAQINHRTGVTEKCVNLADFYPILCAYDPAVGFYECEYYDDGDPFYSECATYEVSLTLPQTYILASTGTQSSWAKDGKITYTSKAEHVRSFAMVASTDFSVLKASSGDTELLYYHYKTDDADADMKTIRESFSYFEKTFGDYPYDTLSVVQTGFCYGGMEYPALTMISDSLKDIDRTYTIVHENAHQWWYAAVGNNQLENGWMDEGLAEYSCVLFFENTPDYGLTREGLVNSALTGYRAFYGVYKEVFGTADTTMNRKLDKYLSDYEYTNIAYRKGLILFENLRQAIGNKRFFAGLADYYQTYRFRIATPDDMAGCFERTGIDIAGYFDSFISGKVIL